MNDNSPVYGKIGKFLSITLFNVTNHQANPLTRLHIIPQLYYRHFCFDDFSQLNSFSKNLNAFITDNYMQLMIIHLYSFVDYPVWMC